MKRNRRGGAGPVIASKRKVDGAICVCLHRIGEHDFDRPLSMNPCVAPGCQACKTGWLYSGFTHMGRYRAFLKKRGL